MTVLRKLLSILLLLAFGSPMATPLLAMPAAHTAGLPACCKRAAAAHCASGMGDMAGMDHGSEPPDNHAHWRASCTCCPGLQAAAPHVQPDTLARPRPLLAMAYATERMAAAPQPVNLRYAAYDRSRGKRGPPSANPSL